MTRHHSGPIPHATGHGVADESTLTPAPAFVECVDPADLDVFNAGVEAARDEYDRHPFASLRHRHH